MRTAARTSSSRWPGSAAGRAAAARTELARYSPARTRRSVVGSAAARRGRARLVSVRRWPVGPVAGRRRRARGVAVRFVAAVRARRSPTDRDHVGIERPGRAAAHRPDRVPGRARRASAGRPGRVCSSALYRSRRPSHPATRRCSPTLPRSSTTDVLDGEFSGLIVPGGLGTDRRRQPVVDLVALRPPIDLWSHPRAPPSTAGSSLPPRSTPRGPSPTRSRHRRRSIPSLRQSASTLRR